MKKTKFIAFLLSATLPDTAKVLLSVLPLVLPLVRVPVF